MLTTYIDDAGNTGARITDENQPYHFLAGLILDPNQWAEVRTRLSALREQLPSDVREHPAFEFHGGDLYNGNRAWGSLVPKERTAIYHDCIGILETVHASLVIGRCDKQLLRGYRYPMHPHYVAFWLCLESIADFTNHVAREQPAAYNRLIVDESCGDARKIGKQCLDSYRSKGPPFGAAVDVSRVIETVYFLDSKLSEHLQLCDLAAYALRRHAVERNEMGGLYQKVKALVWKQRVFPYKRA